MSFEFKALYTLAERLPSVEALDLEGATSFADAFGVLEEEGAPLADAVGVLEEEEAVFVADAWAGVA